ncbi:hypothetical protein [Rubritalea sp.]|uniref:hypothetical protein n=1 Tax=Rubritalea sp. TaxID=2109375 RepID=UPI003EF4FB98
MKVIVRTMLCLSACLGALHAQSTPQVIIKDPAVEVDKKVFGGRRITVILRGEMSHELIKNQKNTQDHWILTSPSVVKIGERVYIRGTASNGPINIKGKVVWFEMGYVQMILED